MMTEETEAACDSADSNPKSTHEICIIQICREKNIDAYLEKIRNPLRRVEEVEVEEVDHSKKAELVDPAPESKDKGFEIADLLQLL